MLSGNAGSVKETVGGEIGADPGVEGGEREAGGVGAEEGGRDTKNEINRKYYFIRIKFHFSYGEFAL